MDPQPAEDRRRTWRPGPRAGRRVLARPGEPAVLVEQDGTLLARWFVER